MSYDRFPYAIPSLKSNWDYTVPLRWQSCLEELLTVFGWHEGFTKRAQSGCAIFVTLSPILDNEGVFGGAWQNDATVAYSYECYISGCLTLWPYRGRLRIAYSHEEFFIHDSFKLISRSRILGGKTAQSIDGIPWEIHDIVDETAYQAALNAFKAERRSDP